MITRTSSKGSESLKECFRVLWIPQLSLNFGPHLLLLLQGGRFDLAESRHKVGVTDIRIKSGIATGDYAIETSAKA